MVFPDMEDIHLPILDKKNTKKYANVNYGYAPGVIINEPVIVESNIPEPIPENIPVQPEAPIPEEKKSDITEVPQLVAKEEIKLEPAENIWDMVTNIFTKSRENDIPIVVENEKKEENSVTDDIDKSNLEPERIDTFTRFVNEIFPAKNGKKIDKEEPLKNGKKIDKEELLKNGKKIDKDEPLKKWKEN